MDFPDTIYALSSGKLPSGVAVIRLSGRRAEHILTEMLGRTPAVRRATYGPLVDADGTVIDRGIALYFPAPASFTGEPCGELHIHGGRAVVAALLSRLGRFDGTRMAEPGEFTRRAFLNGKLDLSAAEALSDLVAAETESQRRLAVEGAGGRQRDIYLGWRQELLTVRAEIEAQLDFSDQEDVPARLPDGVSRALLDLGRSIEAHLRLARRSEMIRDGFRVVILGAPNAGKSTLLNALARRDVAIVTDEPGTTRDVLEVTLDLEGNKVVVADTAGIRDNAGHVESIGIERAMAAARDADLVIQVVDLADPVEVAVPHLQTVSLRVGLKADLVQGAPSSAFDLVASARTGAGLDELLNRLSAAAGMAVDAGYEALPLRERHVAALRRAKSSIDHALRETSRLEICAEEVRAASWELGTIVGLVSAEELLGEIFSRFCIGK